MLTILSLTDKPCFLCNTKDATVEVKLKDKTFSGVVCFEHLKQIVKRKSDVDGNASSKTTERK